MKRVWVLRVIGTAVLLMVLGSCFICVVYRPWVLNWGATDAEVARAMPGDSIIADATFSATRAVTVNVAAEFIWPWLVQIGYRRAGLYSYDILDNDGIPSAEYIIPEFQDLQVGDSIPIGPGFFVRVSVLETDRSMLLEFPDWAEATWAWGLYPDGPNRTRLVTRLRGRPRGRSRLFADLGEIFPMRKSMLGIKSRAETLARQRAATNGNVLFRSGAFGLSVKARVLICRLREAWSS
ncbi:hypothetical protein ACFL3B_00955 [Gemmatimonadota bacterium]